MRVRFDKALLVDHGLTTRDRDRFGGARNVDHDPRGERSRAKRRRVFIARADRYATASGQIKRVGSLRPQLAITSHEGRMAGNRAMSSPA